MKKKVDETKSIKVNKIVLSMSMGEFKAWLEGFSECFKNGTPNKAQWTRVKERLSVVNIQQEIVYRDRPYWWPSWYNYQWTSPIVWNSNSVGSTSQTITCGGSVGDVSDNIGMALNAATEIGKTEALEFTA